MIILYVYDPFIIHKNAGLHCGSFAIPLNCTGLVLCAAVVDTQRVLHTLQGNVQKDVTNQVAVIAESGYTYLTCTTDGGSTQWLFQNGTTVPVFQPFTQFHTRQGAVLGKTMQVQYLAISPFAPTDQGFYRCLSVKNGLSQEVHVGLFLTNGLGERCTTRIKDRRHAQSYIQ